jgi:hypothetical protein
MRRERVEDVLARLIATVELGARDDVARQAGQEVDEATIGFGEQRVGLSDKYSPTVDPVERSKWQACT